MNISSNKYPFIRIDTHDIHLSKRFFSGQQCNRQCSGRTTFACLPPSRPRLSSPGRRTVRDCTETVTGETGTNSCTTEAEEGELGFIAGEVMDILDYEGEWWLARIGEQIGEVPFNFLTYEGAEHDNTAGVMACQVIT